MTFKELEEYQIICSKGSLNKAAKELFITPQGLGRMLKNLETELGCTLVNRGTSGLELTEGGRYLLEYAQQVTSDYGKLKERIERIQGRVCGSVELLLAYDIIRVFDPECYEVFRQRYPNISLSYREYPDKVAEQMLMEGQGNAAISIGPFSSDSVLVRPLLHCPLSLIVYEGHPLCRKKAVTVADLSGEALFIENSSFKINDFVQHQCLLHGFEPNVVYETSNFDICCKMCRMKKGISILPDFIYQDMKTDGLKQIPFEDSRMNLEIAFLMPKNGANVQAADKLYHYLKDRNNPVAAKLQVTTK